MEEQNSENPMEENPPSGQPTFSSKHSSDASSFDSSEIRKSFHMTNITLDMSKKLDDEEMDGSDTELSVIP